MNYRPGMKSSCLDSSARPQGSSKCSRKIWLDTVLYKFSDRWPMGVIFLMLLRR